MSLHAGDRVGPYAVTAEIGAGGMGIVYRARDTQLGRDVALKIVPAAFAADPDRLARFEREARALAALNHPNIATIHGVEESDGIRALVLELVDGETLAERLARGGSIASGRRTGPFRSAGLRVAEALAIAKQIASALDAAHEKGIVHRDLKPANIKITPTGTVKVLDFGLAKVTERPEPWAGTDATTAEVGGTREGVILGTAAYMSPEQARGTPVDKRTDIWAFGCVLYELLTGRPAFGRDTLSDTLAAVLDREPDWSALPPDTPYRIRSLVQRCLQKDCRLRVRDAGDVWAEFDAVRAGAEEDAAPAAARPRVLPIAAAAAVALALGALAGWSAGRAVPGASGQSDPAAQFTIALPPDTIISPTLNRQVAISPDGSRIVYAGLRGGQRSLYIRPIDEIDARLIEGTAGTTNPFFSPDGQSLAFGRQGARGQFMRLALSGGAPVAIATYEGSMGATWGPDGSVVWGDIGLWRVPASGGTPESLLAPDIEGGERWYRGPTFLPGGRGIVFTVGTADGETYDDGRIAVLDLQTREKRILVEGGMSPRYSPSGHLVYARGGSLLAVSFDLSSLQVTGQPFEVLDGVFMSVNSGSAEYDIAANGTLVYVPGPVEGGERVPVWVDRRGTAVPLPVPRRSYLHPRLSPDETRLAVEIEGATHDLYTYEFTRGTLTKLTFDGASHWPLWTPRGDEVTFREYGRAGFTMWSMPADRSGARQRLSPGDHQSAVSWRPDGRVLAFTQTSADTGADVYVMPLDGDRTPVPVAASRFAEGSPKFSPDGRWLAYTSAESGRSEIYVQPASGPGPKVQISTDGGTDPLWAKRGGELFYRNGDQMVSVAVRTGGVFSASRPVVLWTGHYSHGMSTSCGVPGPTSSNYDVASDGQRFLMIQDNDQDLVGHSVNVIVGWAGRLARRSTTN